jgi:hypothetical protein
MPTFQGGLGSGPRTVKNPYEAYFRYERRRYKIQVAIVVGAVLTMILIIGTAVLWHIASVDQRMAEANTSSSLE